jgi:hypothetical protein
MNGRPGLSPAALAMAASALSGAIVGALIAAIVTVAAMHSY